MSHSPEALDLLSEIAEILPADGPVSVGTMFRSAGLRTGKKIVAFLGFADVLIVKLPRARAADLLEQGLAGPVTMGKRTMREWVEVPAGADREATRAAWTGYVRSTSG